MMKPKALAVALAALLPFPAVFPGLPAGFAPLCAVAHAESEVPPPEFETDLGTPLPLRILTFYQSEDGVSRFHHSAVSYFGANGESYLPLLSALESYNASREEAAENEPRRIIRSLYVHRADSLVTSFAESCAMYGGGMRGRYAVYGRNFDTATGEPLTFDDVFGNRRMLANEIAMYLRRNYAGEPFAQKSQPDLTARVQEILENDGCGWSLDPCGATFYFNARSLTGDPYAPIYTATVLYDACMGYFFREKYRHAPDQWCMEMEPSLPLRISLGDSILRTLEVRGNADGVRIIRGGAAATGRDGIRDKGEEVFTDPGRLNGIRPVFVKMRDGRKYLYVDCRLAPSPEDYQKGYDPHTMAGLENRHELRVYDLSGDEIRRVEFDGHFTMRNELIHDETAPKEWLVMTDPENFLLNVTDLPLAEAHRRCRVGADGAPEVIEAIP